MPLRNYVIAHKENKYFHPQKTYCSFNKDFEGLLILMQCIMKLYLSGIVMTHLVQSNIAAQVWDNATIIIFYDNAHAHAM